MRNKIIIGLGIVVILFVGLLVTKKVSPLSWGMWGTYNASSGVALKGYDPVAYFVEGKPELGSEQYRYEWSDVTWHFASAANKAMFVEDPASYAPQFGGFCSFAVSKGFTADILPEAWHIEDGRLYVFADLNVRDEWVADLENGSLQRSTANWAKR